ncbi:hypothetical protein Btru_064608 [Bulinus truncatus]|nr:hypothetical protein Btru_064608 [Bulinus truncatus]
MRDNSMSQLERIVHYPLPDKQCYEVSDLQYVLTKANLKESCTTHCPTNSVTSQLERIVLYPLPDKQCYEVSDLQYVLTKANLKESCSTHCPTNSVTRDARDYHDYEYTLTHDRALRGDLN